MMSKLQQLEADVQDHDEVHAVIADVGEEKDIRASQATFNHNTGLVTVETPETTYRVNPEHIVYWYVPEDF